MDKKMQKGILTGLGAASLTKKKAESIAAGLSKKGLLGKKEAKTLASRIFQEVKKTNDALGKRLAAEIKKHASRAKPLIKKYESRAQKEGKKIAKGAAGKAEIIARHIKKSLK